MVEKAKQFETDKVVELVKQITEQKYSERSATSALEEARRIIRAKGRFTPRVPIKKGLRVCF
jgi:hypothetical protein